MTARWQERALCARPGEDPDLWSDGNRWSDAVAACQRCPVLNACRADTAADDRGRPEVEIQGVRGGLTGPARWRREKQRRAAEGVAA